MVGRLEIVSSRIAGFCCENRFNNTLYAFVFNGRYVFYSVQILI